MFRTAFLGLALALALHATGWAAAVAPAPAKPAAPAQQEGHAPTPLDPLGNLKPYEERRYRIDMGDCQKEKGVDRRVCERTVRHKAQVKSRRRAAARH